MDGLKMTFCSFIENRKLIVSTFNLEIDFYADETVNRNNFLITYVVDDGKYCNSVDQQTSMTRKYHHYIPPTYQYGLGAKLIYMGYFASLLHPPGRKTCLQYLRPKVTLHCYYIYLFWVLVSDILNVFNSY